MIVQAMPYPTSGGGMGDPALVVMPISMSGSTTGDQTFTTTDLGGVTPTSAVIVITGHLTADGSTASTHARMGVAAVNASYGKGVAYINRSGNSASNPERYGPQTGLMNFPLTSTTGARLLQHRGFVADGIKLGWTQTASELTVEGFVIFFKSDVTVDMGTVALGTGTSAISVSGLSAAPDAVMVFGHNDDLSTLSGAFANLSFGVATATKQRCFGIAENASNDPSAPRATIRNDAVLVQRSVSTAGVDHSVSAGNFGADSFTLTPSASTGSDELIYVSLNFGTRSFDLLDIDTPTTTGSQSVTGAGFTPSSGLAMLSNMEAYGYAPTASDGLQAGFGLSAFNGSASSCAINRVQSGAATTDTASLRTANAIAGPNNTSALAIAATLSGFTSDGMTLNYSAVEATAKKGFTLLISD